MIYSIDMKNKLGSRRRAKQRALDKIGVSKKVTVKVSRTSIENSKIQTFKISRRNMPLSAKSNPPPSPPKK